MPDFSSLYKTPVGSAKRPPTWPAGDYPAVIKNYEPGESSQKKTPYTQFNLAILDWPATISEEDKVVKNEDGTTTAIDLSKRTFNQQFYHTPDAEYRLHEFLKDLVPGSQGRPLDEVLAQTPGQHVLAVMKIVPSQDGKSFVNRVDGLRPMP